MRGAQLKQIGSCYGSGGAPGVAEDGEDFVFLLQDLFTTDRIAGAVNGSACEPGPGSRTAVDTESKLTISGGNAVFAGGKAAPAYGDPGALIGATQTRKAGRTIIVDMAMQSGTAVFGWGASAALARHGSFTTNGVTGYFRVNWGVAQGAFDLIPFTLSVAYRLVLIQRSTGTFLIIYGGTEYPVWTLAWIDDITVTASLYAVISNYNSVFVVDDVEVVDFDNILATNDWATSNFALPANPQTATSAANALVSFTWTPGAGEMLNLMFRRIDDDNTWLVRCDQAASKIYLYEKELGIETERGAVGGLAQTWTIGNSYHIVVRFEDNDIRVSVGTAGKQVYTSATFQNTATGIKVSGFAAGINLVSWPLRISGLIPTGLMPSYTYYFVIGDSKSLITTYPPNLTQLLNAADNTHFWSNGLPMASSGGATVHTRSLTVDADLAANSFSPKVILCNLGTNDLLALPVEATWKADYTTIITAVHAKWPETKIYLCKPVLLQAAPPSTPVVDTVMLHGWVDDLVSSYDYVYTGVDETELEGGDGYVTNFLDTAHQTVAGKAAVAALWKTALGY